MKLSVNLVTGGKYVKAGDPLPPDFELPSHLEAFAIYDEPPKTSRATDYPEGKEEFTPKWAKKKGKL